MPRAVTCPCCKSDFTIEDLVTSTEIVPIGMQLQGDEAAWNFYFFNHVAPNCGTTFTVGVEAFASLLSEPVPASLQTRSCDCEGRCTSLTDLSACRADCRWAPYRRFLQTLLARRMPTAI